MSADELFDVTPYAEALTRHFLRHPLSASLPRKFKIGFEGCPDRSRVHRDQRHRLAGGRRGDDGARGFRVTVGGRHRHLRRDAAACCTSSCRSADMLNVAEAVVRVFHRLGDYQHKHRNRHEVPHQVDRVGRLPRGVRPARCGGVAESGGIALPFDPARSAGRGTRRHWPRPAAPSRRRRGGSRRLRRA